MWMISNCRKSKKCRMWIIWSLMLIVILLLIFWKKWTIALTVILVLLAIAMWVEWFNYDADLWKLWETWSYEQSRVESVTDKDWNTVRLIWECVKADVNCDDFKTQWEAQAKYDYCMKEIKDNNPNIEDPVKLDIYGLDRNHDGVACQHLPKTAQ